MAHARHACDRAPDADPWLLHKGWDSTKVPSATQGQMPLSARQ
ncbi:hypothetical protein C4K22_2949 [Pseudomonas chlororaphis subsp. aurantiaca]|nr:hypothetical protein C4K24_2814 [Pseudomonas chlororaphis subsp. aurantiaca]AZD35692.1 hypothetical protein C4K22_2949 [Pseudomonas chlororaphis subsp. aurantiaca]AZD42027.1 hypothetical protein C4K21_2953 [Pseudomonas chlororaphis subsp. aurantiaca]AZD48251.1 hypothetical protein C4K20_2836 [Pseudomonas chlororaphis subsp. aurantiaca]AZD60721.1 hypothetical protein C4K18_2748 [Pseudomonas chlororaphis subsp. aurantiaca]